MVRNKRRQRRQDREGLLPKDKPAFRTCQACGGSGERSRRPWGACPVCGGSGKVPWGQEPTTGGATLAERCPGLAEALTRVTEK